MEFMVTEKRKAMQGRPCHGRVPGALFAELITSAAGQLSRWPASPKVPHGDRAGRSTGILLIADATEAAMGRKEFMPIRLRAAPV